MPARAEAVSGRLASTTGNTNAGVNSFSTQLACECAGPGHQAPLDGPRQIALPKAGAVVVEAARQHGAAYRPSMRRQATFASSARSWSMQRTAVVGSWVLGERAFNARSTSCCTRIS